MEPIAGELAGSGMLATRGVTLGRNEAMVHRFVTMLLAVTLAALLASCSHDLEGVEKPCPAPGCGPGAACINGRCVKVDGGADATPPVDLPRADATPPVDLPRADALSDSKPPDARPPDAPLVDARPDDLQAPDKMTSPDLAKPDQAPQDAAPDQPQPDAKADGPAQDMKPPLLHVDDTFAHFSQGTLSESGAKIFVSSNGNVQLLDRHDLNGDGHLDIVVSNWRNTSGTTGSSYIFMGAAKGAINATKPDTLPTNSSSANAIADLNQDGIPDIVYANYGIAGATAVNSFVFWGTQLGKYSGTHGAPLPTVSARDTAIADLNGDGELDVVFANLHKGNSYQTKSFVYWGQGNGVFKVSKRAELPTLGGIGIGIADLDRDGMLDLVFANYYDNSNWAINSYIYWGQPGATTYSTSFRSGVPSVGAHGLTIADLNADGELDIAFANNRSTAVKTGINSYVYWGHNQGTYSASLRTELPTLGASSVSAARLDKDQHLDLLFCNHNDASAVAINSYIYWGSAAKYPYGGGKPEPLPTQGATGNIIADYSGDGLLDIVVLNQRDKSKKYTINSYVYWGQKGGVYDSSQLLKLPTVGGSYSTTTDPGAVGDRGKVQTFTSRKLASAGASPKYLTLSWTKTPPAGTKLRLQLRSATSAAGLDSAKWYGPKSIGGFYTSSPASINAVHHGHGHVQYRATFESDFGSTPVLDKVTIAYQ